MNALTFSPSARTPLGFLPTPLEMMPRFSEWLGGPEIWIKRDDCTGLGGGGNKTRKLEFLMADALAVGADIVITAGALQSNHARQTAAAAARLGIDCLLVLSDAVSGRESAYFANGNLILDEIFGADIVRVPYGQDAGSVIAARVATLLADGRNPYVIPTGGSNGLGAFAYAEAVRELKEQTAPGKGFEHIIVGSGSGGTQAGLIAGCRLYQCHAEVQGISVAQTSPMLQEKIGGILDEMSPALGIALPNAAQVLVDDSQVGDGYGQPSPETLAAILALARMEGILLDPVYTGKAMAGLIAAVRDGRLGGEKVLFWHTGGSQSLFAYPALFSRDD